MSFYFFFPIIYFNFGLFIGLSSALRYKTVIFLETVMVNGTIIPFIIFDSYNLGKVTKITMSNDLGSM